MSSAASTPKRFVFASKKRVFLRLLWFAAIIIATDIGHSEASSDGADACLASGQVFKNFQSTRSKPPVPDTKFLAEDGSERSLSDYLGKGIVLNFWATWCAPCVREMPQLDRLAALVRGNGIDVLAISEDRKGMELAPKFYKKNKLNDLPVLVDQKSGLLRALKIKGLPSTILINPQGQEIGRVTGIAEWDSIEIVDFLRNCLVPKK